MILETNKSSSRNSHLFSDFYFPFTPLLSWPRICIPDIERGKRKSKEKRDTQVQVKSLSQVSTCPTNRCPGIPIAIRLFRVQTNPRIFGANGISEKYRTHIR
jgi:hypothetical protein